MRRYRLLLFFVFYAVAEMVVPQAVNALEAAEGAEEGIRHARRMRLSLGVAAWPEPAIKRAPVVVVVLPRLVPPVSRTMTAAPAVRKIPPSFAESSSAPEDH